MCLLSGAPSLSPPPPWGPWAGLGPESLEPLRAPSTSNRPDVNGPCPDSGPTGAQEAGENNKIIGTPRTPGTHSGCRRHVLPRAGRRRWTGPRAAFSRHVHRLRMVDMTRAKSDSSDADRGWGGWGRGSISAVGWRSGRRCGLRWAAAPWAACRACRWADPSVEGQAAADTCPPLSSPPGGSVRILNVMLKCVPFNTEALNIDPSWRRERERS